MKSLIIYQKICFLVLFTGSFSCSYLPEPITASSDLIVTENADYILLTTSTTDNNKAGIIFYPGGLVDPHAYIEPFKDFALVDNRTVVILKVSSNLAILNTKKASSIIENITNVNQWIVGGHSLGGVVACTDAFNHPNNFNGIFLLASYSINDLSASDLPFLSITGSKDIVLDNAAFDENSINLPTGITVGTPDEVPNESTASSTIYYEIEGGNHAQFGDYGTQSGDSDATIDVNTQHMLVNDMLRRFLLVNNL